MQLARRAEPPFTAPLLAPPLDVALDGVAHDLGAHCLVEADGGAVVGHAVQARAVAPALVTAVLERRTAPLTSALIGQRCAGLLPGGPLLVSRLADWPGVVHSAPLVRAGQRLGWLWLLGGVELSVDAVAQAAAAVAGACSAAAPDRAAEAVQAALDGHQPLPPDVVGAAQVAWVLTVAGAPVDDLRLALTARRRSPRVHIAPQADRACVVLLGTEDAAAARAQLEVVVQELQDAVGVPLRAGVSEPADARAHLRTAALQADAACGATPPGSCRSIRQVRTRVVLDLARAAVVALPDLGPDPVAALQEHDRRRGTDLSGTVRCWLDAGGDVAATAVRLQVHPNTLRYRLRCAQTVTGVDLDDLTVRLELHLRLDA